MVYSSSDAITANLLIYSDFFRYLFLFYILLIREFKKTSHLLVTNYSSRLCSCAGDSFIFFFFGGMMSELLP